MKTCKNCRCVYADDYNGQCHECGAPMNSINANGSNDLPFRYANQLRQGVRENDAERSMKRGNYENVQIERSVLDVARQFVIVDEEKLREAQNA